MNPMSPPEPRGTPVTQDAIPSPGLPAGSAEAQGFDRVRLERAMDVLEQGRSDGAYPGAVALVARHGSIVATRTLGWAEQEPWQRPMTLDTIFDLASLTKVVAGLSAVLLLLDAGLWSLDDAVARFIPAFRANGKHTITLRHLLTHTSGLPPWRPCYTAGRTPEETFAYTCGLDLEAAPGTQVQYSDLGMILIRALVQRVAGEDLPDLLGRALFAPLGMRDTGYRPPPQERSRITATERGNHWEQEMLARAGLRFDGWREHVLAGDVHDGNAHYALGGVSSHAGLFATASDLVRFGQLYLQEGQWAGRPIFSPAAVRAALRPQTAGLNECYGLGWRLNHRDPQPTQAPARSALTRAFFPDDPAELPPVSLFGDLLSPQAYGHSGFTGTSLVIDPALDLVLVLLTNRVHPQATRSGLDRVRARWHNAVVGSIVR